MIILYVIKIFSSSWMPSHNVTAYFLFWIYETNINHPNKVVHMRIVYYITDTVRNAPHLAAHMHYCDAYLNMVMQNTHKPMHLYRFNTTDCRMYVSVFNCVLQCTLCSMYYAFLEFNSETKIYSIVCYHNSIQPLVYTALFFGTM